MFGYSDLEWGVDLLRKEWIESGAKWESGYLPQPKYWSPIQQLLNIDYHVSDEDKIAIASHSENNIDIVEINTPKPIPIPKLMTISFNQANNTTKIIRNNVVFGNFILQSV